LKDSYKSYKCCYYKMETRRLTTRDAGVATTRDSKMRGCNRPDDLLAEPDDLDGGGDPRGLGGRGGSGGGRGGCGSEDRGVTSNLGGLHALSDLVVHVVVALRQVAGDGRRYRNAGERLLFEDGVIGAEEAVLHHGQLSVRKVGGVADVEDPAVVVDISVVAEAAVGAGELDVDGALEDLVSSGG